MTDKEIIKKLLLDKPIAYRPDITKTFKSLQTGVFMSQLLYWSGKEIDPNGWIFKEQKEMYEETGLTRKNQETARRILTAKNVLSEKLKGSPPKLNYKINFDNLLKEIKIYYSKLPETDKLKRPKRTNQNDQRGQNKLPETDVSSIQRVQAKNTTENTNNIKAVKKPALSTQIKSNLTIEIKKIVDEYYTKITGQKLSWIGKGGQYGSEIKSIIKQAYEQAKFSNKENDEKFMIETIQAKAKSLYFEIIKAPDKWYAQNGFTYTNLTTNWNKLNGVPIQPVNNKAADNLRRINEKSEAGEYELEPIDAEW